MTIRVDNHTTERCHYNRTTRLRQEINSVTLHKTQFGHPDALCLMSFQSWLLRGDRASHDGK
eukprot:5775492-Prymnesium_polylepis.1